MTYTDPVDGLKGIHVRELVGAESVPAFHLGAEPPDPKTFSAMVLFPPQGVVIVGRIGASRNSVTALGKDRAWFADGNRSEEELLSAFDLVKEYQVEAAIRDVGAISTAARREGRDELGDRLEKLAEEAWDGLDPRALRGELAACGVPPEWSVDVGVDYPLELAGWVVAIQRRFAAHLRAVLP